MAEQKKIIYWGPYSGHVGTIKAQINSAHSMVLYGDHDAVLIRAHSEFKGQEDEIRNKGIRLLDLGLSRFFPHLENSRRFARRPYMLVVALFGFFPLIRTLRKEKPDMVVLNLIVIPALFACMVSGVKTIRVISIQGYPHFLGVKGESVPIWKRMENSIRKVLWNLVFPKADYLLTMTKGTKDKLVDSTVLRDEQVRVVNNPVVDLQVLSGKDKKVSHEWYKQDVPLIVGVGRLTKQKGFDVLVNALKKLKLIGLEPKLLIVGEGEERRNLERLIETEGLSSQVVLLGHIADPYPYIAHADLFVLSSRWEDPGHAIIEAAALNVPIVTTDCPSGPDDLVSQGLGGWVCNNGDADDMAEKIKDALDNPDTSKLAVSAKSSEAYTLKSHYIAINALFGLGS